jgi:NAD(P)-dependent dehydrogenase (short-subunit alcohol dehydrogenase family)
MKQQLDGKIALITGGTRGIGLAIARALLLRNARVVVCSRNAKDVNDAVEKLRAKVHGENENSIYGFACDVRSYPQVQDLFRLLDAQVGGLDIIINNAGVGSFQRVEEMAVDEWSRVLETNLSGVFYCCKEAIPQMKKRGGGYIINIGSLAGKEAFAGAAAYCASKFGLVGFSEALMQELRYEHIKVSYVMPGSVNTSFGRHEEQDPATTWKLLPDDVAQVVIDLLEMEPRALPSRVELRPSEPKK